MGRGLGGRGGYGVSVLGVRSEPGGGSGTWLIYLRWLCGMVMITSSDI